MEFIAEAELQAKIVPAPGRYKDADVQGVLSKQHKVSINKWPALNREDKERITTKYKRVSLGPGSHNAIEAAAYSMKKRSINITTDRQKRDPYYTQSTKNLAALPAPNKYQKEDFAKSLSMLSKSPPSIRIRRH